MQSPSNTATVLLCVAEKLIHEDPSSSVPDLGQAKPFFEDILVINMI